MQSDQMLKDRAFTACKFTADIFAADILAPNAISQSFETLVAEMVKSIAAQERGRQ
jgi:hypothetical protein